MRQTAAGSSTVPPGRTLNHKHRTPYIPLPPALPRFELPGDRPGDRSLGAGADVDALDVASTAQRPTVRPGRSPASVRVRKTTISADATAEVQVEDILLEVYAEDPPPPMTRRSPGVEPVARQARPSPLAPLAPLAPHESIAMAIASIVPPAPAQSAAVDALLRASDPAFAPYAAFTPLAARAGSGSPYGAAADYETPSVGPMMMATVAPPPAPAPVLGDARAVRAKRGGVALAIWATVIMVMGVAAGAAGVMAVRTASPRTYARLRDSAKSGVARATRATSKHDAPVAAAAAPAPPEVTAVPAAPAVTAAPPPAAPAGVPTVSIDSLPQPAIAADASLVTFPAYAQGHRVFLDGRVLPVVEGTPTRIKCGRHMLKLGSARKPRVVDFACGREVIVQ
jgi:hypothetical protein